MQWEVGGEAWPNPNIALAHWKLAADGAAVALELAPHMIGDETPPKEVA